jgi:hypothetical protein
MDTKFKTWAANELACMKSATDGGLLPTYAVDKMDALRRAAADGDELAYDLAIARLEGDGYRCEEIAAQMVERDQSGAVA